MIITEIYNGQGLGNQLWCYVVTRVIAKDKGYKFGIMHPEKFKCLDFMDLDFGEKVTGGSGPEGGPPIELPHGITNYYMEKKTIHIKTKEDIRIHDNNLINIADNTKIDGLMQDEQYIIKYKNEIREWLKVKEAYSCNDYENDNICVINFRGGEYMGVKKLFLPQEYWNNAVSEMRKINPNFKFIVITDDVGTAKKFFPTFEVNHFSISKDYSIINNARYLILSNSSFAWFPAWLNKDLKVCIAPKYWAAYNTSDGYWSLGYNITSNWLYLDRKGKINAYEKCLKDIEDYKNGIRDDSPISYERRIVWLFYRNTRRKFIKIIRIISKKLRRVISAILIRFMSIFNVTISYIQSSVADLIKNKNSIIENNNKLRNKIRIYDIFTYNGEVDILEIRLNILSKFVDKFIIVEASTTFSGIKKPLYFEMHKERFKKFSDKISYFAIDDYPNDKNICSLADKSSSVPKEGPEHWRREFYQKESIKKALLGLRDNDICFIGDVDEIWNPEVIVDYSGNGIFKLRQIVYSYYLNNRSSELWAGTMVTKYKNIKNNCLNHLRTKSKTIYTYIKNGGWHFTNMGGFEEFARKLNDSYTPESYKTPEIEQNLKERFGKSDYLGRNFKFWIEEKSLPKYIRENKNKYKKLFK